MLRHDRKFVWLLASSLLVILLEGLSLSGISLPPLFAAPFFAMLIAAIGLPTLRAGFAALAAFNFRKIQLLMAIATIGAFCLGQFEEAATVIILYTLAEKLEEIGIAKSRSSFDTLLDAMPKEVELAGNSVRMPLDRVQPGMVIVIRPGALIPLDGKVVAGGSLVDESPITGEPIPRDKQPGDSLFAGTLNVNGYMEMEVVKVSADTTLAKIRTLAFEAGNAKAKTQQFIERFARIYTPMILALAALVAIVPPLFGGAPSFWFLEALTLLVISCPCALVISTPISVYSAIGAASKMGALIKGGLALESLASLRAIAFDKTRTLTYGKPIVTDVIPLIDTTEEDLLSCAGGIEKLAEHPLSASIVEAAEERGAFLHEVENFVAIAGKGVKADCLVCESKHHCVGKLSFVQEEHAVSDAIISKVEALQQEGKTTILVCTHKEVEGILALADEIRPESFTLIPLLKERGIASIMLTGDNAVAARAAADRLGIRDVKAELLPEGKVQEIGRLIAQYGAVGMVGDGINDAPALASATVGITLGGLGSDTALEASSVVLMQDRLSLIPELISLGRRMVRMIRFNTACAILVKVVFVALAIVGKSELVLAIFADVGVTLLVIGNSLRLLRAV